jgi:hypothetical protein
VHRGRVAALQVGPCHPAAQSLLCPCPHLCSPRLHDIVIERLTVRDLIFGCCLAPHAATLRAATAAAAARHPTSQIDELAHHWLFWDASPI